MEYKVALIQLDAGPDEKKNLQKVHHFFNEALSQKPDLICLPEMFHFRKTTSESKLVSHALDSHFIDTFKQMASKHRVGILLGSFCEAVSFSKKVYNTSVLILKSGQISGVYRKIHLFEIDLDEGQLRESNSFLKGKDPIIASADDWKIGMSICYDLRFPELYRHYVNHGADIMTVPASFTAATGKKHWKTLCRARAIENQCFVLAPNQTGVGAGGVSTYGHSMIIDPDGALLCEASDNEEVVCATLNKATLLKVRINQPCLNHQVPLG